MDRGLGGLKAGPPVEPAPSPADGGPDDAAQRDLTTLARGGALNLAGAVATGLLHFVLLVIITRGLRAQGTGAFYEAVALFLILSSAATLGADVGLSRMVPRYRALGRVNDLRRGLSVSLWPVLAAGVVLGALTFVYASELADVFSRGGETGQLTDFIRSFAVFIPVSALSLAVFAATRGFATMRPTVYLDKIIRPALQPLLVLAAVLAGAGSTVIALAYLGPYLPALVAGLAWMGLLLRRAERPRDGAPPPQPPRPAGRLLRNFWRFSGPRGLAAIFQTTSLWLNTLLIGALRSTREAGVYAASTRYLAMAAMAAVAIRQVLAPKLSELLARRSQERASSAYQTTTSWMVVLNWPIYLALIAFGPALLQVFGRDFAGGQVVLVVLSATMLVATAVGPVDVVLLMGGRSSWNLFNTLVSLGANLALSFALTPRYGLAGAAVAFAVGILLNNLLPLVQVWRSMGLHPFGRGTGVAAVLSAVSFGLVGLGMRALLGPTVAGFVAYAAAGVGLYAVLLWRFRDRLEWEALRGILRRRPGRSRPGGPGAGAAAPNPPGAEA
ncbi:MAG TPA: oligosaccharide flippase family protein [Actinomycetes bacterium]|jgi:O-antigen/teichoic acid export membrane protein|nr:oligosaccharide flippase family protein [Actinomycetes bacterium]